MRVHTIIKYMQLLLAIIWSNTYVIDLAEYVLNKCVIQAGGYNLDLLEDQINDDHENHILSLMVSS